MAICRKSPYTNLGSPARAGGLHLDNATDVSSITAGPSGSHCAGTTPGLRYREHSAIWEFSNDGLNWYPLGSGSGTAAADGTIPLGLPPDGTYDGGYFSFLATTQINDAIDRMNELLLGIAGSGSFKTAEFLTSSIPADTSHTLPSGETFEMATGDYLDVFLNGQLLTHTSVTYTHDYEEVTTSSIKFTFPVPASNTMTYIIRRRP